ncbi:hypothetical protein C5167_042440 [Papaver somniferum]|uniref:Aldose 1-epimerase n=1 Tax=Papaver somniferum TaxID=3469 RepID=A0A4Y7L4J3_PAPSO|nr:hypothetical protein C5167_042440 [Papaver somniferum]
MGKISVMLCFLLVSLALVNGKKEEDSYKIEVFELKKGDFSVKLTNWGASIMSIVVPDSYGKLADIALGYDSALSYVNDTTNFGRKVGRVANRIGGAKFTLNGATYKLNANDGNNMLHEPAPTNSIIALNQIQMLIRFLSTNLGGAKGFGNLLWKVQSHKPDAITFSYDSYDSEQGFPGKVLVSVTYRIMGSNKLLVHMKAKAIDKATPVNLAHHTYFNLGGHNSGDIKSNKVQIFASHITPTDSGLIPTGVISPVKGTPFDFLTPQTVGSKLKDLPGGFDINYALDGATSSKKLKKTAVVSESKSGRTMELWSNQPGVQFYTANTLANMKGKGGYVYGNYAGLCLETQAFQTLLITLISPL